MSGPPSDVTICTRERMYFFTSRNQRMKMTLMPSSPPHPHDLPHLVRGGRALVPDGGAGEREEGRLERIAAGLCLELRRRAGRGEPAVVGHGDARSPAVRLGR